MFHNSHVLPTLPASDVERAMAWYATTLGLEAVEVIEDEGVFYRTGGRTSLALYPSDEAGKNPATAAAFLVEDFDAAAQQLRDAGVVFEEVDLGDERMVDGVLTRPGGTRAAWFRDSEGNILALSSRSV